MQWNTDLKKINTYLLGLEEVARTARELARECEDFTKTQELPQQVKETLSKLRGSLNVAGFF